MMMMLGRARSSPLLRALVTMIPINSRSLRVAFPTIEPPPIPARYSFHRFLRKCRRYPRCTQRFGSYDVWKKHVDSGICIPLSERGKTKNQKSSSTDSSSREEEFPPENTYSFSDDEISVEELDDDLHEDRGKKNMVGLQEPYPLRNLSLFLGFFPSMNSSVKKLFFNHPIPTVNSSSSRYAVYRFYRCPRYPKLETLEYHVKCVPLAERKCNLIKKASDSDDDNSDSSSSWEDSGICIPLSERGKTKNQKSSTSDSSREEEFPPENSSSFSDDEISVEELDDDTEEDGGKKNMVGLQEPYPLRFSTEGDDEIDENVLDASIVRILKSCIVLGQQQRMMEYAEKLSRMFSDKDLFAEFYRKELTDKNVTVLTTGSQSFD